MTTPTNENLGWAIVKAGLRSISASIPVVECIAQAWSEYDSYVERSRIEEFVVNLKENLLRMESRLKEVEGHIRSSGEASAVLMIAMEKVARELEEEKRARITQFAVNALALGKEIEGAQKISLLHSLDALTAEDVKVLMAFRDNQRLLPGEMTGHVRGSHPKEQFSRVVSALCKLQARGMLYECSDPAIPSVTYNVPDREALDFVWGRKKFALTPQGLQVVHILKLEPAV